MIKNTTDSYGLIARLFHWIMFLLILGVIIGGILIEYTPERMAGFNMIEIHKSFGFTVLILAMLRLIWRLINPCPRDLGKIESHNRLAHIMHGLLYILMLLQPVSGILMSQAFDPPVRPFGLFELPALIGSTIPFEEYLPEIHRTMGLILAVLVVIHAAAALKHHFIDKDRTLLRMIVGK